MYRFFNRNFYAKCKKIFMAFDFGYAELGNNGQKFNLKIVFINLVPQMRYS